MKIYGQTLGDILRQLPWQYKIVMTASVLFIVYILVYLPYVFLYLRLRPGPPTPVPLVFYNGAIEQHGELDPSIAYNPQSGQIWMAYTFEEKPFGAASDVLDVRLAMARGGKNCKEWDPQIAGGFEAKVDGIMAPDDETILRSGIWRIETPALVYDPDDPGKEWKLYAYKYFWENGPQSSDVSDVMAVARRYGVIVYRYATVPTGDWSTEQWLFSPGEGFPPPPYEQSVLLKLNQLDPVLKGVTSYARPSVLYKDGALVMTLSAFTGDDLTPEKIIMIASLDHGNSWRYVNTLLQKSDLAALGNYTQLAGASLVVQDGKAYLAAVLGDAHQRGQGTFIFGFDDFSQGLLQQDAKTGAPLVLHKLPLPMPVPGAGTLGGGAAAYNDACKSGMIVMGQVDNTDKFKLYRSPLKPVENTQQGEK